MHIEFLHVIVSGPLAQWLRAQTPEARDRGSSPLKQLRVPPKKGLVQAALHTKFGSLTGSKTRAQTWDGPFCSAHTKSGRTKEKQNSI